ncbi:serine/threonine-protein kinase [Iningainema tapete]|uniref:Serine/threonine protein kinase n=1 Tax=Iningainema tapete BLCC-T55 TaxID=2748662 RepID=A0A8J6XJY5_9CYAN|nr:serine/threonine-protein kinase [Iningainema tapete]MBD2770563.1 serine/threonine protein kinase [Iningainema tapete BLCC-T55]
MICCLNPDCSHPLNPDGKLYCQKCGNQLTPLLRGRYHVTKVLSNEGGFSRTYLALDVDKLNERCVVKQLAPKVQGTYALNKAIESFKREAERLQELGKHPQIPTLLAYFEQDNYLYLVQEFIDGQNLRKELQQRLKYSETEIREVLLKLLSVLKFIHDRGVIHRDIKPQNIMRRAPQRGVKRATEGDLVLIDFGASKQLTATVRAKPGTTIGTHGYSPLEQMQNGVAYAASDLYGLGATCFHLLTNVSPSTLWSENGYSWVTYWRQYLKTPISDELASVIDKLLSKQIKERYQSADEVIKDLTYLPPIILSPTPSILRKRILMGAAIILIGFGGVIYVNHPQPLYPLQEKNSFLVKTLTGHSNLVTSIAISSNANSITLISGSFDTTLKLWNLSTGKEIITLEGNAGSIHSVATSTDGFTLASGNGDNTIKLWNVLTRNVIRTLTGHTSSVESVAISPDGKMLASGSFNGIIKLWELPSGKEIATITGHSDAVKSVAFSPDGQTLASGGEDNTIKLWDLNSKQVSRIFLGHSKPIRSLAFNPNTQPEGGILVSSSADDTIKLWNVTTGQEIYTFTGHSYSVNSVAIASDGKTLASGSSDHTIKLWDLENRREIRTFKGHSQEVTSVVFSPNGKTLASGSTDGKIKIWRVSL